MKAILLISAVFVSFKAQALQISNLELYQRCHAHLTGEAPSFSDPLLLQVVEKRIDGVQACQNLLRLARLNGNAPLPKSNVKGIKILENFFKVHSTWFETRMLDGDLANSRAIYEASPGGLYYTKALFDSSVKYSDIFRGTTSFEAIRSKGSPERTPVLNLVPTEIMYRVRGGTTAPWTGLVLPEVGTLEGIRTERVLSLTDLVNRTGSTPINGSMGGGLLGNRNYVMRTTKEGGYRSDGAVMTPRRWGRSIFVDFLCQDVPVVRVSDATPFVEPMSSTPFRTTSGCTSCHASMDQLAGLIRNYSVVSIRNENPNIVVPFFHATQTPSTPYQWKANGDPNYFSQAAKGKFYYRTIDGQLLDRAVDNLDALGNLLGQVDDVYICTASRYVEHFTGVKYPMNQVASNPNSVYSNAIRSLASELKSHQDPMKLVEQILSSEIYSDSKFKVGE